MVALDNQGIMGLKAGGVVHAPAFELAAEGYLIEAYGQVAPIEQGHKEEYIRKRG